MAKRHACVYIGVANRHAVCNCIHRSGQEAGNRSGQEGGGGVSTIMARRRVYTSDVLSEWPCTAGMQCVYTGVAKRHAVCIHRSGKEICSVYTQEWPRDMQCIFTRVSKRHAVGIHRRGQETCSV